MRKGNVSRRRFLAGSTAAAAVASGGPAKSDGKPALLGGSPVKADRWPSWPKIRENDEKSWMEVLKEGRWNRMGGRFAEKFEGYLGRTGWAPNIALPLLTAPVRCSSR